MCSNFRVFSRNLELFYFLKQVPKIFLRSFLLKFNGKQYSNKSQKKWLQSILKSFLLREPYRMQMLSHWHRLIGISKQFVCRPLLCPPIFSPFQHYFLKKSKFEDLSYTRGSSDFNLAGVFSQSSSSSVDSLVFLLSTASPLCDPLNDGNGFGLGFFGSCELNLWSNHPPAGICGLSHLNRWYFFPSFPLALLT